MSLARWTSQIKNQKWIWDDTVSLGQLAHLWVLLREIVPAKTSTMYGTSLIFNNQTNANMGLDGYDNYQAPQDAGNQLFERRMWVSGSLKFHEVPMMGQHLRCMEHVLLVRKVGDSVFVTIQRRTRELDLTKEENEGEVKRSVVDEVRSLVYKQKAEKEAEKRDFIKDDSISSNSNETPDTTHKHHFLISPGQVARFSALSYNLHKIHHDREYCLSEGLEDVVVLGPMLVNVMLHYFASVHPKVNLDSFKYRMSDPCYVNRPLTMTLEDDLGRYELAIWENGRKLCLGTATPKPAESV